MRTIKRVTLGCMLVLFGSLSACAPGDAGEAEPAPDGTREAPYVGQGVIQRIGDGQLEIRHQAIPGFMGAMTMPFPITEEVMNDSLEVGDEIIFKIAVHPEHGVQIFSVDVLDTESDQAEPAPDGTREAPYVGQGVIRDDDAIFGLRGSDERFLGSR